jgi:hypothetical protein
VSQCRGLRGENRELDSGDYTEADLLPHLWWVRGARRQLRLNRILECGFGRGHRLIVSHTREQQLDALASTEPTDIDRLPVLVDWCER